MDADHPGIGATTFSLMRARIVLHEADRKLLAKTVEKAVERGLFPRQVLALVDSSPVLGSGPCRTPTTCSEAPSRRVVQAAREDNLSTKLLRKLGRYTKDTKPQIHWADPEARRN